MTSTRSAPFTSLASLACRSLPSNWLVGDMHKAFTRQCNMHWFGWSQAELLTRRVFHLRQRKHVFEVQLRADHLQLLRIRAHLNSGGCSELARRQNQSSIPVSLRRGRAPAKLPRPRTRRGCRPLSRVSAYPGPMHLGTNQVSPPASWSSSCSLCS
jgi:hypothetical protein